MSCGFIQYFESSQGEDNLVIMKKSIISHTSLIKALKWIIFICLTLYSLWFMSDVWVQYMANVTSFKSYKIYAEDLPTTVLCFSPHAKKSVLDTHNMTLGWYTTV